MTHPQTNCLCEPARACSCRHPTIKLLEEAWLRHINGWYSLEETYGLDCLADRDKELIDTALRTLIEKHEDVEGDMPQEVYTANKETLAVVAENREPTIIALACSTRPSGDTTSYHRADTIINEITRRIEDGENNF